jgi:hypothetical protein
MNDFNEEMIEPEAIHRRRCGGNKFATFAPPDFVPQQPTATDKLQQTHEPNVIRNSLQESEDEVILEDLDQS